MKMKVNKQNRIEDNQTLFVGEDICFIPTECPICGFVSEELNGPNNHQSNTKGIKNTTDKSKTPRVTFSDKTGADNSDLEGMISPFTQTNKENAPRKKSDRDCRIPNKKIRTIKNEQHCTDGNKGFIPVINFHVFERIRCWLSHLSKFIFKS